MVRETDEIRQIELDEKFASVDIPYLKLPANVAMKVMPSARGELFRFKLLSKKRDIELQVKVVYRYLTQLVWEIHHDCGMVWFPIGEEKLVLKFVKKLFKGAKIKVLEAGEVSTYAVSGLECPVDDEEEYDECKKNRTRH